MGIAVSRVWGRLRLAVAVVMGLSVAACVTPQEQTRPKPQPPRDVIKIEPKDEAKRDPSLFLRPTHLDGMEPVRVALLLPLSSDSAGARAVAESIRDSAELAVFRSGRRDLLLIVKDTAGTPQGAAKAAEIALEQGAEIILGPLFAPNVLSVAPKAREFDVPVVAFSTDRSVAGDGVYLLSFQVEQEVERVLAHAFNEGLTSFAALIPEGAYGERVQDTFVRTVQAYGGEIKHMVTYDPRAEDFLAPARRIAEYDERKRALERERARLREAGDEVSKRALERLEDRETFGTVSYQAVLVPEGGNTLRALAPMLPYYDVDNRETRFLGTGLWDDPALWREPSLVGGWFAAPPPESSRNFMQAFKNTFGYTPPRIAGLGYDAVTLAAALADGTFGRRFTASKIEDPSGFAGIDGIFRFTEDGFVQRGLAVMQVKLGDTTVVAPSPASFSDPSFSVPVGGLETGAEGTGDDLGPTGSSSTEGSGFSGSMRPVTEVGDTQ